HELLARRGQVGGCTAAVAPEMKPRQMSACCPKRSTAIPIPSPQRRRERRGRRGNESSRIPLRSLRSLRLCASAVETFLLFCGGNSSSAMGSKPTFGMSAFPGFAGGAARHENYDDTGWAWGLPGLADV